MKTFDRRTKFDTFCLQMIFFTFTHMYVAYETDEHKLQEMFTKLHTNLTSIVWKGIDNLNPRTHKQLCDDVLKDILPPDRDYNGFSYYISLPENLEEDRLIRSAQLKLQNETVPVTVVQCKYEEITFYVTRADDDHVFTLIREPETEIFHLKAGLHPVKSNYTVLIVINVKDLELKKDDCEI